MDTYRIALAGNPNTGKSTIFNALTGSNQHVGNWPGKTVARRSGWFEHGGLRFEVVDLPGTYSLSAYSPDEAVARDYIVRARPDLVVNVLDATNLERNLYLTAQIVETAVPLLNDVDSDVIDVLTTLGFSIVEAQTALQNLPRDVKGVDERVQLALQFLDS